MISFNGRNRANPHFREVADALIKATWQKPYSRNANYASIQRAVQSVTVSHLMNLASNENARAEVRGVATDSLRRLQAYIKRRPAPGNSRIHHRMTIENIEKFLARPVSPRKHTRPLPNPPGDPIGSN